ncbi:peptide MFS transporter [Clostridium sp. C105KSO13]|uniref:peptide MFS transporter n=1 Tax=Clostridium sp. C105KSO13 TaxID=1776045 RepID=UPI00074058FE|nr:peptide MFS transporter [Clostridium sp. C105KSO13]CUX43692.1 Dipeptide and tripeptide permease A [Clostridium sp. C105KSO13]
METAKKKKPFGFYVCALGFTFERCAFYTVKYLLAIWIATNAAGGGLGLSDAKAASMSAIFVAATYITPIFGGYVADYWLSPRICVIAGMILMGIGYLFTWQAHSTALVWVMIVFVAVGTGLFKGNLSGVNGLLFENKDDLNEAFSIQYSFVNIGSFIGTTFVVLLTGPMGYNFIFLLCAIFLFIDAVWFAVNQKALGNAGKKPFKHDQRKFVDSAKKKEEENKPLTTSDKKRILAIVLVTVFSVVFWILWYMAYMPTYYYFGWGDGADFLNHANWFIGNWQVPTSYFDSMNAITCIILGPVLAALWTKLAKRPQGDLSMFKKTALGMILVGVSFAVMVIADIVRGDGQANLLWIVVIALLMSIGEMIFSPLGNSFITMFAPAKVLGLLLGLWPIAVFFATMIYPALYAFLKTVPFQSGYGVVAAIAIVLGLLLWFLSGKLDKLAVGEK